MIRLVTKALAKSSFHLTPLRTLPSTVSKNLSAFPSYGNSLYSSSDCLQTLSYSSSFSRCFATKKTIATPAPKKEKEQVENNKAQPRPRGRPVTKNVATSKKEAEAPTKEEPQKTKNIQPETLSFNKVDDQTSLQNSQSFFMKCVELLPEDDVADLVQKIDILKAKLSYGSGKTDPKTLQNNFLVSCKKLFEKHDALQLMDYLVNIKVHDLRTKMLGNTIFGFDQQVDLQLKIDKFHEFSASKPQSLPHSIDGEKQQQQAGIGGESIQEKDRMLIEKISKMNLGRNALKGSLDTSELKGLVNESEIEGLNEEGELDLGDFDIMGGNLGKGAEGIHGISPIMNDLEDGSQDEENIMDFATKSVAMQAEIDVHHALDTAAANILENNEKKTRKDYLREKFTRDRENIMVYTPQGQDETIYFQQRGFEKRAVKPTNCVYLYGLPYEIKDPESMKESLVQHFQEVIGEVKSIQVFSFKDYLEISQQKKHMRTFENFTDFEEIFDPLAVAERKASMDAFSVYDEADQVQQKPTLEAPKKDMNTHNRLKRTEKVLRNLKIKSNKRLDKSYALVELVDKETKEKALSSDLRIFGMYINGRMCMIDDADYKFTLTCYNVHWGASVKNFYNFVNKVFEEKNLMDLTMELPPKFEDKILTKFYVLLRFSSLRNTLRAMQALEGTVFEKRSLKLHHLYGSLKLQRGTYSEMIDTEKNGDRMEKFMRNKLATIEKIKSLSREEEASYEKSDPLVKIEKDIQTYVTDGHAHEAVEEKEDVFLIKKVNDSPAEERWYQNSDSLDEDEDHSEVDHHVKPVYSKDYKDRKFY